MDAAKYIILEYNDTPILFPCWERHDDIARGQKVISAGQFEVFVNKEGKVDVCCWGKSTTLGVEANPETDARRIKKILTHYSPFDDKL